MDFRQENNCMRLIKRPVDLNGIYCANLIHFGFIKMNLLVKKIKNLLPGYNIDCISTTLDSDFVLWITGRNMSIFNRD